jgi:hypothetical protein
VRSKKFIKCWEKVWKVLKWIWVKKIWFWKEFEKKGSLLPFQPSRPTTHLPSSRSGPRPRLLFFSPAAADTGTPPVGASLSLLPPLSFPLLHPTVRCRDLHSARPPPPRFPSSPRVLIKAINRPLSLPGRFLPSPCPLYARAIRRPSMASRRPPRLLVSSPLSLCPYLSLSLISRSPLCTRVAPTHARAPYSLKPTPRFRHCRQWSSRRRWRVFLPFFSRSSDALVAHGALRATGLHSGHRIELCPYPPERRPSPPPSLLTIIATSSSSVNVFEPSLCGEHHFPVIPCIRHSSLYQRPHAGETRAAPFRCRPPWTPKFPPWPPRHARVLPRYA